MVYKHVTLSFSISYNPSFPIFYHCISDVYIFMGSISSMGATQRQGSNGSDICNVHLNTSYNGKLPFPDAGYRTRVIDSSLGLTVYFSFFFLNYESAGCPDSSGKSVN